jgi:hypothetical protein
MKKKKKKVIFQDMGCHVMAHSAHLLAHHLYNSLYQSYHTRVSSPELRPNPLQWRRQRRGDGGRRGRGDGGGRRLDLPLPTSCFSPLAAVHHSSSPQLLHDVLPSSCSSLRPPH